MEDPEWRDEYVLNDTGKVYTGNYKQVNQISVFNLICSGREEIIPLYNLHVLTQAC